MDGQQNVLHEIFDLGAAREPTLPANDLPDARSDDAEQFDVCAAIPFLRSAHQVTERIDWRFAIHTANRVYVTA
jgi:hypothetical protein